jgi:hypothetical protein
MGNMIPAEVIFDDASFRQRPSNLWTRSQHITGTIREMHFWAEEVSAGQFSFNVRKNGSYLFTLANSFTVNVGTLEVSKTGLSIPATRGEVISFDLVIAGTGRVTVPLIFLWITEEGV